MPRIFLIKPRTKSKKVKTCSNNDETETLSSNTSVTSEMDGNQVPESVDETEDKTVANGVECASNSFKTRQHSLDSFLSSSSGEIIPSDTSSIPGKIQYYLYSKIQ